MRKKLGRYSQIVQDAIDGVTPCENNDPPPLDRREAEERLIHAVEKARHLAELKGCATRTEQRPPCPSCGWPFLQTGVEQQPPCSICGWPF
jgi:hypothetical protein